MALADITTVKKRVISLLNANPGLYLATVSGNVGAFPSDAELADAIFESDSNVAMYGYAQSPNSELANPFNVTSPSLADGAELPFHHGAISLVELTNNDTTWFIGIQTANVDDVIQAKVMESYVGTGAYSFLYNLFGGQFFTTALHGRVTYPQYVRTSALQCNQNETTLIIAGAMKILLKNASPAPFEYWAKIFDEGIAALARDGVSTEVSLQNPPSN